MKKTYSKNIYRDKTSKLHIINRSIIKYILNHKIFILLAIATIIIKIVIASVGTNADVESYQIVGDIISQGKTIYDNTARYNYAPAWAYVCGLVAFLVKLFGAQNVYVPSFHLIIAIILAIIDIVIAMLIAKIYRKEAGILFLLNPISFIISGHHSQFDNVAIMLGLLGWYFYIRNKKSKSYILFGISMIFKHILLFFPIWLMMIEIFRKTSWKNKFIEITKISSIYMIFIGSFIIEIVRGYKNIELIIHGISKNVIMYRGYGSTLGNIITDTIIPKDLFNLSLNLPILQGYMFFFLVFLTLVSYIIIRRKIDIVYTYPMYLAVFFVLSSAAARQYFAIPLIAIYIFYDRIETIIFSLIGFIFVATNAFGNLAQYLKYNMLLNIFGHEIKIYPWVYDIYITYNNAQVWVLILCISLLLTAGKSYSSKTKKVINNIYLFIFLLSYLSIGLYVFSKGMKKEYDYPTIIKENNHVVKFTCITTKKFAYPIYEINKDLTLDKDLITKFTKCPNIFPLF